MSYCEADNVVMIQSLSFSEPCVSILSAVNLTEPEWGEGGADILRFLATLTKIMTWIRLEEKQISRLKVNYSKNPICLSLFCVTITTFPVRILLYPEQGDLLTLGWEDSRGN